MYSDIESTGMHHRDQMRRKLVTVMREGVSADAERRWATECALKLEECLHGLFKAGKSYTDKARSLVFNLTDPKNRELRARLLLQELTPKQLITTDVRKLASNEMQKERQESVARGLWSARNDWEVVHTKETRGGDFTGLFACEDCGSRGTGFVQYQIDRADEPMTNFVYCYDCGHRWKC